MARTLTPVEACALMDELRAQATGQKTLTGVNASNFVSVGEDVLATGYENTLNALSLVLGRTIVAARPYKSKFGQIQAISTGAYTHRLRKISYYSRNDLPAGNFNTNLFPENLIAGATHQKVTTLGSEATASMWLQNPPVPLEQNFAGSSETLSILRHTPKEKQKLFIYDPLLADAEAQVYSTIFNPEYLGLPLVNIERVGYWQSNYSETARSGISVTPAVYNAAGQTAGSAVALSYVVGLLFDEDALVTDYQLDSVDTTPFEARKHFANTWYSFARNIISDPTENAILYFMAD